MIHDTTRRTDDDFRTAAQLRNLVLNRLTAVYRNGADAMGVSSQLSYLVTCLHGKLARRTQDENHGVTALRIADAVFNSRHAKCHGLSSAGVRTADDISARHDSRNRTRLNFRRLRKFHIVNGAQDRFGQSHFLKADSWFFGNFYLLVQFVRQNLPPNRIQKNQCIKRNGGREYPPFLKYIHFLRNSQTDSIIP